MKIEIVLTDGYIEPARVFINRVFSEKQQILRKDQELIPLDLCDQELKGPNKELFILYDRNVVMGTAVLTLGQQNQADRAEVSYLARDPSLQKSERWGYKLLDFAEKRAKKVHIKKIMEVSTVYHPKYPQQGLENLYFEREYKFREEVPPEDKYLQAWETEFHTEVRFRWFEKIL